MKKRIIVISLFVLLLIGGSVASIHNLKDKNIPTNELENKPTKNEVKDNSNDKEMSEIEVPQEDIKADVSNEDLSVSKEETKNITSNNVSKNSSSSTTTSKKIVENPTTSQQVAEKSTSIKKEEVSEQPSEKSNDESKQQENVKKPEVISFYASITHGKKEFSTESEALARGLEIATNELNYVMDYNADHPDSQIKPDINYYRVYPSVIDENGKTWYYLHFFCQSGNDNDDKLKKMY